MSQPDENGRSGRDHLLQATRRGKRPDLLAQLRGPRLPGALLYLWEWYLDLRRGFEGGGMGSPSLTWPVLDAWTRQTQSAPEPHEVSALFLLDSVVRDPEMLTRGAN